MGLIHQEPVEARNLSADLDESEEINGKDKNLYQLGI